MRDLLDGLPSTSSHPFVDEAALWFAVPLAVTVTETATAGAGAASLPVQLEAITQASVHKLEQKIGEK